LIAAVAAALVAGALNAADIAVVPQAQAQTQPAGARDDAQAVAGGSWCSMLPPGFGHPPVNPTPVTLQVLQRSVEPVPATDGLVHLPYAAQVTNTLATPANILGVVPVDPLADFAPTGRNFIIDEQGATSPARCGCSPRSRTPCRTPTRSRRRNLGRASPRACRPGTRG
jgi:hypothetical protein